MNNIFSPFVLKNLNLKNRLVFAAADAGRMLDARGNLLASEIERFCAIAKSGVDLIETGSFGVDSQDIFLIPKPNLSNEKIIPSLKKLTARIHHETDAKIAAQIYHRGIFAGTDLKYFKKQAVAVFTLYYLNPTTSPNGM